MSTIAEAIPRTIDLIPPLSPTSEVKPIQLPKPDPKVINDPLREKLALIAFRVLLEHQVKTKYDMDQIQTWTWKAADSAMRGKATLHRAAISMAGIVGDGPPGVPMTIDEAMTAMASAAPLLPIEEIK